MILYFITILKTFDLYMEYDKRSNELKKVTNEYDLLIFFNKIVNLYVFKIENEAKYSKKIYHPFNTSKLLSIIMYYHFVRTKKKNFIKMIIEYCLETDDEICIVLFIKNNKIYFEEECFFSCSEEDDGFVWVEESHRN